MESSTREDASRHRDGELARGGQAPATAVPSPKPADAATGTGWLSDTDRMLATLSQGYPPLPEMQATEARAAIAARMVPIDNEDDVESAEDRLIDGRLRVRVYRPHGSKGRTLPAILYMHGGGFVVCSIESHDGFCRRVARHTDSIVVSVDYRLAPEHKAPAAVDDAYAALGWLVANAAALGADAGRVLVAGDSAGANIAAVLCLLARDRKGPEIAGQILLYPTIAPDFETESYRRYATGYLLTRAAMQWYWRHYLGGEVLPEPAHLVAPLYAPSHAGLPPAIVVTAGRDPLCSEGASYAAALKKGGVAVLRRHYPDMFHGFIAIPKLKGAEAAREILWSDIKTFFKTRPA